MIVVVVWFTSTGGRWRTAPMTLAAPSAAIAMSRAVASMIRGVGMVVPFVGFRQGPGLALS